MSVRQAAPSGVIAEMPSGALDGPRVTRLRLTSNTTTIDLTRTTFVKPGGVTTLAAVIDAFCRTGRTLHVIAPADYGAYNYLARVHFSHFLEELGCTHTLPSVRENDLGHDLVPLTRVATGQDANALGAAALNFAGAYDEGAAQALCRAIGEAGENVPFHSGSPAGFVAAQRFPANGHFEFAVADAGYGLLHTLQAHGAKDHASAIELALTEGISATGEANRGFGLSSIEASVANALSGSLSLLTGDTLTHATASGRRATTIDFPYQGTVVFARFRGQRGRRRG